MKTNNKSPAPFAITEEKQTIESIIQSIKQQSTKLKLQQQQLNTSIKNINKQLRDQNQIILSSQTQDYFTLTQQLLKEIEADTYFQVQMNQVQTSNKQLYNIMQNLSKEIPNQKLQLQETNRIINFYKCIFQISIKQLSKEEIAIIFHRSTFDQDYGYPIVIKLKDDKKSQREQFWNQFIQMQ